MEYTVKLLNRRKTDYFTDKISDLKPIDQLTKNMSESNKIKRSESVIVQSAGTFFKIFSKESD